MTPGRQDPSTSRWIGARVRRKEDPRLLTGRGRFVDDVQVPGALSVAILRSPHAHARIGAIDASRALSEPGIIAVFSARDIGPMKPVPLRVYRLAETEVCLQPPLPSDRVRYVGQAVAVVVASDPYRARDVLESIRVEFEPVPVVADARRGLSPDAPLVHDALGGNVVERIQKSYGDVEAGLRAAPLRLTRRFRIQRHTAVPLEPRGLVADYDRGTKLLTVWGPTKVPHFNRRVLADMLEHPEHLIHFIETEVGGSFGPRGEFYPEDFLVPWVAMRLGRPVRWVEDRREHLAAVNHSREQWHEVEVGLSRDGKILALADRVVVDMGAYVRPNGFVAPERTAAMLCGPYRIPNYRCEVLCVLTNKTPAGTYRGPGRYEGTVVRERIVDLFARELGLDPAEIRRRNFIQPADMPYSAGTTADKEPVVYDSGDYPGAFETTLTGFDYDGWRARQAEARRQGRFIGVGIGCFVEKSGTGPWETARVQVDGSGSIVLYTGTTSQGQGLETTLSQICADQLAIDIDAITVVHGDTARVPVGIGTWGSRGAVVGGNAVREASLALREKIVKLAAMRLEVSPEDLVLDGGRVYPRGVVHRALTFRELAGFARPGQPLSEGMEPGLDATAFFMAPRRPYPYGTHIAAVEVDADTGRVSVLDYAIVYDVGRAINPLLVEGQLLGGLAQGLGGALLEELSYDEDGQLLTATFMDYAVPTAADMPKTTSIRILEDAPTPLNPLGIKGAGEGGCTGAGGALAYAVDDALAPLGVVVTDLPLTPGRIFEMVRAASSRATSPSP